ncbi:MAG: trypsin-like peptidase domain-containing protein [Candidatus Doudnabacteria bacterium]|nr:trypsin-like peptidase domain-containing protein [Candidatus Doudnabacteria bacterium]
MENNQEIQTTRTAGEVNQRPMAVLSQKIIILVVVLSVIFGAMGGAGGAYFFLKAPAGQKLLSVNQSSGQKISLTEDSAVIDVVKQASPAVVSIIISQDLNKIPGYGMNPYSQNPFFNFFGGGQSQQQQSTAPNVQEVGAGSGFFVSADGLILTNKHVVSDLTASYTVITSDGKKYDAKVVAQDPVNDLAIVKIGIQNAPYLKLADSSRLQVGQHVIAIGNSLGQYQNTVTSGIVSGIGRSITAGSDTGSEDLSGVIQTDAAINPGNSGGPLLDITGQVIGMNTAIDQQGQLVGFAIPSNEVQKALESFQKNGKITRPFLGVRYITITSDIAKQNNLPQDFGALIVRGQNVTDFAVQPGSPADKAGLVENDIILEVNGTKVDENNSLSTLLQNFNVGDTVDLQVYHKGKTEDVKVTLGESK